MITVLYLNVSAAAAIEEQCHKEKHGFYSHKEDNKVENYPINVNFYQNMLTESTFSLIARIIFGKVPNNTY